MSAVRSLARSFGLRSKDQRRANRRKSGERAWIRLEGGFAVRPCKVIDLSDTGVQISVSSAALVPNTFTFLTSRGVGLGRRARVKWRSGSRIGAEFV